MPFPTCYGILLAAISAGLMVFQASGSELVLEQDFEAIPTGQVGRFGSVMPGSMPYGVEGRWSEFGTDPGSPVVRAGDDENGQFVELSRIEGAATHVLIGSTNTIRSASEVVLQCDLWIPIGGSLVVALAHQNTQIASVWLRTDDPNLRLWNPNTSGWEDASEFIPTGQWLSLNVTCDTITSITTITLYEGDERELMQAEVPLDSETLKHLGFNSILFNPQPGSDEPSKVDNVSLQVSY